MSNLISPVTEILYLPTLVVVPVVEIGATYWCDWPFGLNSSLGIVPINCFCWVIPFTPPLINTTEPLLRYCGIDELLYAEIPSAKSILIQSVS